MLELLRFRLGDLLVVAGATAVALPFLGLALFVLEHWQWFGARMTPSRRSLVTDLGYALLGPFTEIAARISTTIAIVGCGAALGRATGLDLLDGFGPVVRQPRWLMLAEMLVFHDFLYYWAHRAAHTVPFLWRLHAVHHSTRHLRWSSALRAHPGELYVHVVTLVPMFVVGFPADALVPLTPLFMLYAILIHCDVGISLRRVSYLVNTPMFHGWHHALDVSQGTRNYAGLFPVFDALFGTYCLPEQRPRDTGIEDRTMPDTLLGQLAHPFQPEAATRAAEEATPDTLPSTPRSLLG